MIKAIREYFANRRIKRAEKSKKTITNPKAIKDDRWASIHFLADYKDASFAVPALLLRFDYSLEHGINDTREKEACLEAIVDYGDDALPFVRDHLQKTTRIAWPIKTLKAFGQEETVVIDILKESLNFGDVAFDQFQVDKNYDILCYLAEYQLGGFVDKVTHFLKDNDERVRFACVELLIEQQREGIGDLLEPFLGDTSAENTRIRQAVIDAFVKNGWKIKDRSPFPGNEIREGVGIAKDGSLTTRDAGS